MIRRFLRWCIGWYELAQLISAHEARIYRLEKWHNDWLTRLAPLPEAPANGIIVRAKVPGVYGSIYRTTGEKFLVRSIKEIGTWMEIV